MVRAFGSTTKPHQNQAHPCLNIMVELLIISYMIYMGNTKKKVTKAKPVTKLVMGKDFVQEMSQAMAQFVVFQTNLDGNESDRRCKELMGNFIAGFGATMIVLGMDGQETAALTDKIVDYIEGKFSEFDKKI